jgi:hypothetical protein
MSWALWAKLVTGRPTPARESSWSDLSLSRERLMACDELSV